ncbi:MAG: S1 RNA-binding domain-containing protein [Anaerolineales bacterium]
METGTTEKEKDIQPKGEEGSQEQPEWFQDFVDNYDYDRPQRGEILKGVILDIGDNSLLLDVGLKRDAIVTSQDLDKVDQETIDNLEVGDEVFVSVIRSPIGDDDLLVSLSRGIAYESWVKAKQYMEEDELLELPIIDQNKGGLLVEFENLRGFVPNSHIPSLRRGTSFEKASEAKAKMIGDTIPLKVIEVNRKQRRLVFSARVAQKEQREKRLKELEVGDVITSRVVNVVDFGVFVDLDGVDGLVHKSEIAWDRVYDPSKYFKVGDQIEVKVVDVDVERERVSLSRKALLPNPWEELEEKYDVGDLVEGKVVSVLDFGAFVELPEGLQGLVHVSEIGYANMGDPESVVQEGDNVLVRVLSIEPERERVSLSMRRVPVDDQLAWMMDEDDAETVSELEEGADEVEGEAAEGEGQEAEADEAVVESKEEDEAVGAAAESEAEAEEPAAEEEKAEEEEEAAESSPEVSEGEAEEEAAESSPEASEEEEETEEAEEPAAEEEEAEEEAAESAPEVSEEEEETEEAEEPAAEEAEEEEEAEEPAAEEAEEEGLSEADEGGDEGEGETAEAEESEEETEAEEKESAQEA